LWRG